MRLSTLLLIITFLSTKQIQSQDTYSSWQPDTVSTEEMVENFEAWMQAKPFRSHDASSEVMTVSTAAFRVVERDADLGRVEFSMDSPQLPLLLSITSPALPPSRWKDSLIVDKDGYKVSVLCWDSFRRHYSNGLSSGELRHQATGPSNRVATWFTGPICLTARSRSYCHNQVARYAKVFEVKQGEIIGGPYTLEEQRGLYSDSTANPRHIGITYWEEFYGKDELALFSDELKRQLGADTTRLFESGFDYTFLLTTDARGKAHLHLLWSSLTGNQLEVDADSLAKAPKWVRQFFAKSKTDVTRLTQAVEALPAGRFGHFITTDGRIFPGRYLKFNYDFLSKRFTVTDYLFDARRPMRTGQDKPESTSERVARERNHLLNSHTD